MVRLRLKFLRVRSTGAVWIGLVAILVVLIGVVRGEQVFAPQDIRAIQKLRNATGLSIWSECTHLDNMCSGCSKRLRCEWDPISETYRINELRLEGSALSGRLPRDLLDEHDALSRLRVFDVSANPKLDVRKCVPYERLCENGLCEPKELSCLDRKIKRRGLQQSLVLSNPAELAAWRLFYDSAEGPNWLSCGGERARNNPCDPLACQNGGIDRYVLCDTINNVVTLLEIRLVNNAMRGTFNATAVQGMPNLRLLWVPNTFDANLTNANIMFNDACIDVQRCFFAGFMSCNFENTGLELCPRISTDVPTLSPTRRPTSLAPTPLPTTLSPTSLSPSSRAPTSVAPTTRTPTLQPTTRSPTSLSPTSKAPTLRPTLKPTLEPTSVQTKAPTRPTGAPTHAPTSFPSFSPTIASLPQSDYLAWQSIFSALNGAGWDFCDLSDVDPCNFPTTGCEWHTRIVCRAYGDGTLRIVEMVLAMNNMRGILPPSAINTLGPYLTVMDVSDNALAMTGSCIQMDFCYSSTRCNLLGTNLVLCPRGTLSPTLYAPVNPQELLAWTNIYDSLDGSQWTSPCNQARNAPCLYSSCVQCIFLQNELHISAMYLSRTNLRGFLDDAVFWYLPYVTSLDISFNNNAISSDDCIRVEQCLKPDSFCDFTDSGVTLCPDSFYTIAPALSTRPQLLFADLVAFYWLYDNMNGPKWLIPPTCVGLDTDPCFGCPSRVQCVLNPSDGSQLIIKAIILPSSNVIGAVPVVPLSRLFSRGLYQLDLSGAGNQLSTEQGGCLELPPCYNGNATCSFANSGVSLCSPPIGAPPTASPTQPTRMPTFDSANPCRTSGGLVPENTACASPFRYSSISFSSCISFTDRPPLSTTPFAQPRIPTDLWCPTVGLYNIDSKDSWGFCNCLSQAPTTQFETKPPFSIFTLVPTKQPSTRIPTRLPTTKSPATSSPTAQGVTRKPTQSPTVSRPSSTPSTSSPSLNPTMRPNSLTLQPTGTMSPQATKSPTSQNTLSPSLPSTSTFSPTTRSPSSSSPTTTSPSTSSPSVVTKSPTSQSPTTGKPTPKGFTNVPTRSPTLKPTNSPSKTPTSRPSRSPSSAPLRKPSRTPSRTPVVPTPPTFAPTVPLSANDMVEWQRFYDSLGGPGWSTCSNNHFNPCACNGGTGSGVFVTCARVIQSAGRRLQGTDTMRITDISLPNNNVSGTLPTSAVQGLNALSSLNLANNPVSLPPGSSCTDLSVCQQNCKIGTICDSSVTSAPSGSRNNQSSDNGAVVGIAIGIVIVLLLVLVLLLFCIHKKCPERLTPGCNACFAGACCVACCASRAEGKGDGKSESMTRALIAKEDDDEEPEYGNPMFHKLAEHAVGAQLPSLAEQRPDGRSHFSLMAGEALPQLKNNETLSEAKLEAMKLDEMARTDVADIDGLLINIGLGHKIEKFKDAGVTDVLSFMRLNDQTMRNIGLNLGERVRVKRTIDIRSNIKDDLF